MVGYSTGTTPAGVSPVQTLTVGAQSDAVNIHITSDDSTYYVSGHNSDKKAVLCKLT